MKSSEHKDSLAIWMDGAGRYPLLSGEETLTLARKIQELPESSPERARLVNKLVEHNLRFVIFLVKKFLAGGPSGRTWGCQETVDFLQVGAIGLRRAAEKYDPSRGYSFITYANFWIRSKIVKYGVTTRSTVHVSESMIRNIISYKKNGFVKCKNTGEPMDEKKILPLLEEAEAALYCVSLNAKNDSGNELLPTISDARENFIDEDRFAGVDAALTAAGVNDIGKKVLMLRLGLGYTQQRIADELGINRNTVRAHTRLAVHLAKQSKELAALV